MSTQDEAYSPCPAERKTGRSDRRRREREIDREAQRAQAAGLTEKALKEIVTLGVAAYVQEVGYRGAVQAMEDEATALCGPKGRHDPSRQAVRYGHADTSVRVLGRRVGVSRPRVRRADGSAEMGLSVMAALSAGDADMAQVVVELALGGVSQRGYESVVGALAGRTAGAGRQVSGQSRSTVNRYFVEATGRVAKDLEERRLMGGSYRVLFMDGIGYDDHLVVAVMGVRDDGSKEVLGLREGSTENAEVCSALLESLIRRGLDPQVKRLVVIDGGKGIRAAVERVLAGAKVQRCQAHKWRNLEAKLPKEQWADVKREVMIAWRQSGAVAGEQQLKVLANRLQEQGQGDAAESLREGLEETLTISGLGVGRKLLRLLSTTNAIESSFSTVARAARRVTSWQSGNQVVRWVVTGLMLAQRGFRQSLSAQDMEELAAALDASGTGPQFRDSAA